MGRSNTKNSRFAAQQVDVIADIENYLSVSKISSDNLKNKQLKNILVTQQQTNEFIYALESMLWGDTYFCENKEVINNNKATIKENAVVFTSNQEMFFVVNKKIVKAVELQSRVFVVDNISAIDKIQGDAIIIDRNKQIYRIEDSRIVEAGLLQGEDEFGFSELLQNGQLASIEQGGKLAKNILASVPQSLSCKVKIESNILMQNKKELTRSQSLYDRIFTCLTPELVYINTLDLTSLAGLENAIVITNDNKVYFVENGKILVDKNKQHLTTTVQSGSLASFGVHQQTSFKRIGNDSSDKLLLIEKLLNQGRPGVLNIFQWVENGISTRFEKCVKSQKYAKGGKILIAAQLAQLYELCGSNDSYHKACVLPEYMKNILKVDLTDTSILSSMQGNRSFYVKQVFKDLYKSMMSIYINYIEFKEKMNKQDERGIKVEKLICLKYIRLYCNIHDFLLKPDFLREIRESFKHTAAKIMVICKDIPCDISGLYKWLQIIPMYAEFVNVVEFKEFWDVMEQLIPFSKKDLDINYALKKYCLPCIPNDSQYFSNLYSEKKLTLLHMACAVNSIDLFEVMLYKGAMVTNKNDQGENVLEFALKNSSNHIVLAVYKEFQRESFVDYALLKQYIKLANLRNLKKVIKEFKHDLQPFVEIRKKNLCERMQYTENKEKTIMLSNDNFIKENLQNNASKQPQQDACLEQVSRNVQQVLAFEAVKKNKQYYIKKAIKILGKSLSSLTEGLDRTSQQNAYMMQALECIKLLIMAHANVLLRAINKAWRNIVNCTQYHEISKSISKVNDQYSHIINLHESCEPISKAVTDVDMIIKDVRIYLGHVNKQKQKFLTKLDDYWQQNESQIQQACVPIEIISQKEQQGYYWYQNKPIEQRSLIAQQNMAIRRSCAQKLSILQGIRNNLQPIREHTFEEESGEIANIPKWEQLIKHCDKDIEMEVLTKNFKKMKI